MREVLERLGRILRGCGYPRADVLRAARAAFAALPARASARRTIELAYLLDAPHVLTLWHTDPACLDARGRPRALPARGSEASIEALLGKVNAALPVDPLIEHLERYGALRRHGARWVPRQRVVSYRGDPLGQHLHGLQVLAGMLRNVEHNVAARRTAPTWFEYVAENRAVPSGARRSLDRRIAAQGMEFLKTIDLALRQQELRRTSRERTVHLGVGVYRFERPAPATPRLRRTSRR